MRPEDDFRTSGGREAGGGFADAAAGSGVKNDFVGYG